jgi:hypothetical protein
MATPSAVNFTLQEAVGIEPPTATINTNVQDTLTFKVAGTQQSYTWTIINEIPETAGNDVADFTPTGANVGNSIQVVGMESGTFQLTAERDTTTLTSGTITVVAGSTKDYTFVTGLNLMALARTGTNLTTAAELGSSIGANAQTVVRWDATGQGFVSHVVGFPVNNFALEEGGVYFISVSGGTTYSLTGGAVSRTYSLVEGLNTLMLLPSKSTLTKAADLGGDVPNAETMIRWDPVGQGFVSHVVGFPVNNFDVFVDEGYFISASAAGTWP